MMVGILLLKIKKAYLLFVILPNFNSVNYFRGLDDTISLTLYPLVLSTVLINFANSLGPDHYIGSDLDPTVLYSDGIPEIISRKKIFWMTK